MFLLFRLKLQLQYFPRQRKGANVCLHLWALLFAWAVMIIATEPAGGGYEAAHDIGAPMWGEAFMCKLDSHRNMLLCLRRPWHRLRGGSAATCLNISSMETTKTDELASASQQPPEDAHAADTNSRTNTQARETAAEQAHPEILSCVSRVS